MANKYFLGEGFTNSIIYLYHDIEGSGRKTYFFGIGA